MHQKCVGCERKNSEWSPVGTFALHTVMGREGRCRKGLEPKRRLSETTRPQSPNAFRITFRAIEVTDCVAPGKRAARHSHIAHRRLGVTVARQRPVHTLPHFVAGDFTRYRRPTCTNSGAGVQGHVAVADPVPRAHGPVVFLLPLRIDDDGAPRAGDLTTTATGGSFVDHRGAREALRDSAPLAALGDIADNQRSCGRALRPARCRCILQWTSEQHGIGARVHRSVGQADSCRAQRAWVRRAR